MAARRNNVLAEIRFLYLLIYSVYFACLNFIPYRLSILIQYDGPLFTSLGIVGLILLVVDLFTRRNLLRIPYAEIILLFFVVFGVSILWNFKYQFMGNVKCMIWMAVQVLYLGGADPDVAADRHRRHIRIFTNVFILLWFIGAIWSFGQYLVQYSAQFDLILNDLPDTLPMGFSEGRLFGVFIDPNYAAVCSLFAIGFALYNIRKDTPVWAKIWYAITIAFQGFYVILSGSRTAELALLVVSALAGAFLVPGRF
ncbi:MAG: hypothetical protein IJ747_08830, partial [Lachnospiraceae bacterium]|nr:hypothetical protein [Lachnospiraceae bacterium]